MADLTPDDLETLRELVEGGLTTDGAHHKQWYLARIAWEFELGITADSERGIAP
jgi:hypothetical protein